MLSPPAEFKEGRVAVLLDGRETGLELKGQILEAALEAPGGWLLFLTHDVPYEEQLDLVLLDEDLRVRERASLGWIETPGLFEDLRTQGDSAAFRFIGSEWRVRVLPKPRWRLPLIGPVGLTRPPGLSTRLEVRRA